jgi:3-dehydroquinate dehydratase-2
MATARLRVARAARRAEAPRVLCLSGPNLQLLGTREPDVYGKETLSQIHERLHVRARDLGATIDCRQSNHEGTLCDWIAEARDGFDALLLNAGAYTHTSIALYDAIRAVGVPCVEVHLSNPDARESFRHESRIAAACVARVAGFGGDSYVLALEGMVARLARG